MKLWTEVRRRVLTGEISRRQACAQYELHGQTLQKILGHVEPPGYRGAKPRHRRKMERFLPLIAEILVSDDKAPKKQRHTAQRIFEREAAAARYAVSQVEFDLQNRLAPVFEAYANARNQVSRYRETILPAAEESLTLTRQMYQAGETNYLGLLTAQRTFAQTNRNYLDAVLQMRTAEAEIEGLLLSGSLQYRPGADAAPVRSADGSGNYRMGELFPK